MLLPQVGHWPSCDDCDSVASSRDEQYPQLKPKRFPPVANRLPAPIIPVPRAGGGGGGINVPSIPTVTACFCAAGTRSVALHVGQRTSIPACASSADSDVLQTLQGKISMGPRILL